MSKKFQQVSYAQFRQAMSRAAGQRVKNKGLDTYVYDHNNHPLAVLKAASMDAFGRIIPAQYFVRQLAA